LELELLARGRRLGQPRRLPLNAAPDGLRSQPIIHANNKKLDKANGRPPAALFLWPLLDLISRYREADAGLRWDVARAIASGRDSRRGRSSPGQV
jgi:hypothetical protein